MVSNKLSQNDRSAAMRKTESRLSFIDLFAGAGGLSEGFTQAGFEPITHVEMDAWACTTLRTRACYNWLKAHNRLNCYIDYVNGQMSREEFYACVPSEVTDSVICETMSNETMPSIFKKTDAMMKTKGISKVDILIGGPPCQAYSVVGRSRKDMSNDPRNQLYKLYCQVLQRYRPEMFVFENVPGLLTAGNGKYLKDIIARFDALGYDLEYQVVNASDYGVLQNRKRIILVGWQKGSGHRYPLQQLVSGNYKVADILNDLPPVLPGERANEYLASPVSEYLIQTGIRGPEDILLQHNARTNREQDREIYRCAIQAWSTDHKRLRYSDLPPELITHKNTIAFQDRFKVVAADSPTCHTLVAHICKDGHYYIHPDLKQARSVTIREAARIQSFPDNFYFEGGNTAAFRQIGNAVPPLLARKIAEGIRDQYEGDSEND